MLNKKRFMLRKYFFAIILYTIIALPPTACSTAESDDEHVVKAEQLSEYGKYDKAINEFKLAVKKDPINPKLRMKLGDAYYHKYQYLMDKKLRQELSGFFGENNKKITSIKENLEKIYGLAASEWEKAIKLDDKLIEAHYSVAVYFKENNNFDKAELAYQKVISLDPNSVNAILGLATIYELRERYDLSLHSYKEALKIDPNYDYAHYKLALIYHSMGNEKEALREYNFLKSKNSIMVNSLKGLFEK
jgi:tetratricopeptide (TPR) repeat protein